MRPDTVVGQVGPLLELDVDNVAGQLGDVDEDALLVLVMTEAIFACLFVDCEYAPRQVGVILQEVLARIQDAVGVGVLIAIEQPRAVLDLRLRHHWIESGPRVHVAANERRLAIGML